MKRILCSILLALAATTAMDADQEITKVQTQHGRDRANVVSGLGDRAARLRTV
jgi:hypothetical protein